MAHTMTRVAAWVVGAGLVVSSIATGPVSASGLTAAQIVEKNIAARGGLETWRKIQTMVWFGHIESARSPASGLPFVLEMKRPDKTRFEIKTQDQMAVRVFDGSRGWKWRSARGGRPEVQPYTAAELNFARDAPGLDGPLMDYQAKGVAVTLDGIDKVEEHETYRLNIRLASGVSHHIWIDAESFLDIKYDRESSNAFGQSGTVVVYLRDYRTIDGLQVPFTIESGSDTSKSTDKMVIDKVSLNPPLADRIFAKPTVPRWNNRASIDASGATALRRPTGPLPSMSTDFSTSTPQPAMRAGEGR